MEVLSLLQSLGFTLPSPAYLVGVILFGLIGVIAYRYGKKNARNYVKWLGIALMLYPYLVPSTWMMYIIGLGLCGACYHYRER